MVGSMLVYKCKYDIPADVLERLEFVCQMSGLLYFRVKRPIGLHRLPSLRGVVVSDKYFTFGIEFYNNPFNNK